MAAEITTLLTAFSRGDREAGNALLPLVYNELRRIAHNRRAHLPTWQGPGTTSLVHEVYLNLAGQTQLDFATRAHFFYLASVAIRNLLVDHARHATRQKRSDPSPAEPPPLSPDTNVDEVLAIDEALNRLAEEDSRLCRIVECRFFGGLTVEETAETLDLSPATVKRGWDTARAWLYRQLRPR